MSQCWGEGEVFKFLFHPLTLPVSPHVLTLTTGGGDSIILLFKTNKFSLQEIERLPSIIEREVWTSNSSILRMLISHPLAVCPSLWVAGEIPAPFSPGKRQDFKVPRGHFSPALRSNAFFPLSKRCQLVSPFFRPQLMTLSDHRGSVPVFSGLHGTLSLHILLLILGSVTSGLLTFLQFSCFLRVKPSKKKKKKGLLIWGHIKTS